VEWIAPASARAATDILGRGERPELNVAPSVCKEGSTTNLPTPGSHIREDE
jgi:hypothetical protein